LVGTYVLNLEGGMKGRGSFEFGILVRRIISRQGGINAVLCFLMKQNIARIYTSSKMSAQSTPLFYTPIA
jgi:hypothetical protein